MSYALRRLALRRFNRASARILKSIEIATDRTYGAVTAAPVSVCETAATLREKDHSSDGVAAGFIIPARAIGAAKECRAKTGDEAEGARQKAPTVEPVSRSAAGRTAAATSEIMDATAGETATDNPNGGGGRGTAAPGKSERIDLSAAPSGMESSVQDWRRGDLAVAEQAVPMDDGKAWCGPCDARVPTWFGVGCIAGSCPLKVAA